MAAALPLARTAPAPAPRPRRLRFALVFTVVIAAVSLLPYLLAYLWTPPGHHFAGFFFIADDATTYLAKMREGADGSWLWNDPYTSEPHGGVFLFGFYLLFGHLAALLHLPMIAAYHLARITGAIALVLAAERLCRRLLPSERANLGLVLVVLGSGAGFLAQAAGNPAIFGTQVEALDLHLPELSGWYSILAIPHFAWATALIIAALLGLLRIMEAPGLRPLALTALALIALTAIHPQMIPVLAVIWVAYRVVLLLWGQRLSWRALAAEAAAFAATLPLLAYNAWILFRDPTIAEWAHQWRHQAPGPVSLVVSLGLPLLLATIGMTVAWRRRDQGLALLLVWPPLVVVLLYLPNLANIQRRLLDALFVPLGILAVHSYLHWRGKMASNGELRYMLIVAPFWSIRPVRSLRRGARPAAPNAETGMQKYALSNTGCAVRKEPRPLRPRGGPAPPRPGRCARLRRPLQRDSRLFPEDPQRRRRPRSRRAGQRRTNLSRR